MMKVLDRVKSEKMQTFDYPDEVIFSNLYFVSLSHSLRSFSNLPENLQKNWLQDNEWLRNESSSIEEIPVIDFDNITKALGNGKKSCDGLFYNFSPQEGEQHFLAELKNTGKRELLDLLKSDDNDGLFFKVSDSVYSIKNQLEFGGQQENEELIKNMHFFIVYAGKNNVPSRNNIKVPMRAKVDRNSKSKQSRAGRINYEINGKDEKDIYNRFGQKILKLGLQECYEDTFPGDALPRVSKSKKDGGKVRAFSIFSATNFAEIVNNGFFDEWNWGKYMIEDTEDEVLEKKTATENES